MAKAFCLLPEKVVEFKKALKDKEIKIADLLNMTTEERIALLEKYAGGNAKNVNFLFEQKLVLKNKMLGIKNWASKVGEVGKYSPEGKEIFDKAMENYKSKQMERTFNPKEEETFLSSLAEYKFGTAITKEEATNVFNLTQKADEFLKSYDYKTEKWASEEDKTKYAASKVVLENYVADLKEPNLTVGQMIKGRMSEFLQTYETNKTKAIGNILSDILKTVNDNIIEFVATADNSFIGRQGLNTLQTHPTAWWDGAKNSFIDFAKTIKGKNGYQQATDAVMGDMYSRSNYLNGDYKKAGIITKTEEQYPLSKSLPERIPVVGRILEASKVAFKGSALRMRMDLFDLLKGVAKDNESEWNDIQIKDNGKMINSLTARGQGKISGSEVTRLFLWAPKMLKGNIDVLTAHFGGAGLETTFARKQAWTNLAKITGEVVGISVLLNAISPNTVELNPLSSDFLKIKKGNTRIDALTAGKGSIITLVARLLSGYTKNAKGEILKINSGNYGASTMFDVGINFLTNKLTPPARTVVDYLRGTDANYQNTTVMGEILNKMPISIQNFYKVNNDYTTWAIIGSFLDFGGFNSNTYMPTPKKLKPLKSIKSIKIAPIKKPTLK